MSTAGRGLVAPDSFDRALQLAARGQDVTAVADALSTLYRIVSVHGHPAGSLDRIIAVARNRMATTDSAMIWQNAMDLAVSTGDEQLRTLVEQLAAGTAEPSFSTAQHLQLWVRRAARRALSRKS